MNFSCPNTQAHYNEAVLCLNFGTPQNNEFSINLEQTENLLFLGVPIPKHIRVFFSLGCQVAPRRESRMHALKIPRENPGL